MKNISAPFPLACLLLVTIDVATAAAQNTTRPAMIVSGPDSVASQLHYPPKAKAAKKQVAIPFYCEVEANGKATHIQLYGPNGDVDCRTALLAGLTKGRFQPAMSGGRAVPVIAGGTAFFMFSGNQPIIAVALSTAEKDKTAALSNYIQPQLLSTSAEFRRKLWQSRNDTDIHLRPGVHPGAIALAQVDAQGNMTGVKITAESPPDSGWGPLLLKGFKGAKFIPALSNGKPVAGEFDFIANYEDINNPDAGPATGTHVNRDDYDR